MRVQKLREEAAEKERDEHFNTIRPVIPTKQKMEGEREDRCPCTHDI
jgi:hypothetical protein